MNTYVFQVKVEKDEDRWRAFYPPWEDIGASTWGYTRDEALKNIQEVLSMIIEEFAEEGQALPDSDQMTVSEGPWVAVNV